MFESLYNQVAGLAQGLQLDYKETATHIFVQNLRNFSDDIF